MEKLRLFCVVSFVLLIYDNYGSNHLFNRGKIRSVDQIISNHLFNRVKIRSVDQIRALDEIHQLIRREFIIADKSNYY